MWGSPYPGRGWGEEREEGGEGRRQGAVGQRAIDDTGKQGVQNCVGMLWVLQHKVGCNHKAQWNSTAHETRGRQCNGCYALLP